MKSSSIAAMFVLVAASVFAQSNPPSTGEDDTQRRIRRLEEQVRALQEQIKALQAAPATTTAQPAQPPQPAQESLENVQVIAQQPAPSPVQPGTAAAPSAAGGEEHHAGGVVPAYNTSTAKIFNPDIGVIGNFISVGGKSASTPNIAPTPSFTLQESEMSLQSIVDPYARADFFLAFGEEGVEVEEGYVSLTALPAGLLAKAGKFRAAFGRLNAFHNHTLPWADRPIVMFNLLGGSTKDPDTGIKDAGVSVSRLFPIGRLFLEGTAEVFRGDSGTIFKASKRSDVSTVEHLRSYFDISEAANFEAGASYARGKNELGSDFRTQLYGADLTYRWRPLQRAIYRSLALRSELIWSRREQLDGVKRAFGYYASAEYQFVRRWSGGLRLDEAERAYAPSLRDRGASAVLTFRPSEFTEVRWQYRRSQFAQTRAANELLFQLLFVTGAHGAHPF